MCGFDALLIKKDKEDCKDNSFRGAGDTDTMHNDIRHLMDILGISTHARPKTPHQVFISEVIPVVVQLKAALDVAMSENQRLTKIVEDYENK